MTDITDYIDKYGGFTIKFDKTNRNEDPDYDYQIMFSVDYKNKKSKGNKNDLFDNIIIYKKDDEFNLEELVNKILDEYNLSFDDKQNDDKEQQ